MLSLTLWGRRECAFLVGRAHCHLSTVFVITVNDILGLCATLSRWPSNMVFEITLRSQNPRVSVNMMGLQVFSLARVFLSFAQRVARHTNQLMALHPERT